MTPEQLRTITEVKQRINKWAEMKTLPKVVKEEIEVCNEWLETLVKAGQNGGVDPTLEARQRMEWVQSIPDQYLRNVLGRPD